MNVRCDVDGARRVATFDQRASLTDAEAGRGRETTRLRWQEWKIKEGGGEESASACAWHGPAHTERSVRATITNLTQLICFDSMHYKFYQKPGLSLLLTVTPFGSTQRSGPGPIFLLLVCYCPSSPHVLLNREHQPLSESVGKRDICP